MTTLGVTVPMCAICFSYYKIFMYVRSIRKNLFKISGSSSMQAAFKQRQQEEIQLAKTFAVLCVFYVICYTPFTFGIMVDREDEWSKTFYAFSVVMSHLNNSANCVLYGLMNKRFQNGYAYFLRSLRKCTLSSQPDLKPIVKQIPIVQISNNALRSGETTPQTVRESVISENP